MSGRLSGRLHAPGWAEAQRAVRRLPLRCVVARRPQYEQGAWAHSVWQIETLECGHEDVTGRPGASKRRCWQCGQTDEQARALLASAGDGEQADNKQEQR